MRTEDFDFNLPEDFIAQTPAEPRDHSRLLVLNRKDGSIEHTHFYEIGRFLSAGDLLVINRTRVIPARLFGQKIPGGGKVEVLLLRKLDDTLWECLVGGKKVFSGTGLQIDNGPQAVVVAVPEGAKRLIRFDEPIENFFNHAGHVPLPPYIHNTQVDPERYQTVFNKIPGSAAAPTAGLHFTEELIKDLQNQGVQFADITLHVGLDTFAPVREDNPESHVIHTEWCELDITAANKINKTKENGGRVIAVGTTSVRTLESAAFFDKGTEIHPWSGDTQLFILPGYSFHVVDSMLTNFHLPKSTLLMLVSAFAGREKILETYEIAKGFGYRFFSFGDAMLII